MSADNWAVCPRCKKNEMNAISALDREVEMSYGEIPIDDFLVLRNKAIDRRKALPDRVATFREDYEIYGAEDGAINISYSGSCKDCGLKLKFNDYRPMDI